MKKNEPLVFIHTPKCAEKTKCRIKKLYNDDVILFNKIISLTK